MSDNDGSRLDAIEMQIAKLARAVQSATDVPRTVAASSVEQVAQPVASRPTLIAEATVYSGGDSGGWIDIDISSVVPTGAAQVLISGYCPSDNAGGSTTPSTIEVRKNAQAPSHHLCQTLEAGLSGMYSLAHSIVDITNLRTFQANVSISWGSGSPPDAKIYVYAYSR